MKKSLPAQASAEVVMFELIRCKDENKTSIQGALFVQAPPLNIFTAAAPAQSAQPAHTHTSSPDVPDKSLACGVCENCCSMLPGPACHRLQAQMVAAGRIIKLPYF